MSLASLLNRISGIDSQLEESETLSDAWLDTVARVRAEIRQSLAPEQLEVFDSQETWSAACCARQCGKTFMAARLLIDTALGIEGSTSVYVSDTRDNAVKVMWSDQEDGLPAVLRRLGLIERERPSQAAWDYVINLSTLVVTFRNGSMIELTGADRGAWSKFRGRKLNLIVGDEMQRQKDQNALEQALRSDLPDVFKARRGRFVGLGTVGRALRGLWFEVNAGTHGLCPIRTGWGSFHWTARELSGLTPIWERQLEEAAAMGIDTETDPEWLREKRGLWVRDEQGLVHMMGPRSTYDGRIPELVRTRCPEHSHLRIRCVCDVPLVPRSEGPSGRLLAYCGFDFGGGDGPGSGDPCGVAIGAISREEGVLWDLHSEEFYAADSDAVGARLRSLRERFDIQHFYLDPAWKLSVKDASRAWGLHASIAVKGNAEGTDEDFWHAERRAALNQGTMRVLRGGTLHDQLESLVRDPNELERGHVRPMPGQPDHAYDSWRYLFRMVRTRHVAHPEPPVPIEDRDRLAAMAYKDRVFSSSGPRGTPTRSAQIIAPGRKSLG